MTNDVKLITEKGEKIFSAEEIGKRTVSPADILGGSTVHDAAKIFMKILKGEGSWAQNAVVLANAAVALHGSGGYNNYDDAYAAAVESLESGNANRQFQKLMALQ